MKNKYETIISNKNLGIEILRTILCFWVVLFHCLNIKYAHKNRFFYYAKYKSYHVPCFTFISFFFTSNIFIKKNIDKIKSRFERLLIPYLVYPIAFWVINNCIYIFFHFNMMNKKISFYELYIQILFGYQFLYILWFLMSMMMIILIFSLILFACEKYYLHILQILSIIIIFFQYSYKDNILDNYPEYIRIPLTHMLSQIPFATGGISFSSSNISLYFKNHKNSYFVSFIYLILLIMLYKYDIFIYKVGFKGFENIYASFINFIAFYSLPINKINIKIQFIIKIITSFTQGVYCLHIIICYFVKNYLDSNQTFVGSVIIYLISYVISFLMNNLLKKTKLRYCFV